MRRPTIGRPAREPAIVALRFPAATESQRLRNNALAVHAIESSRLAPGRRRVICARLATRTRCGRGGRAVEGARLESVYAGNRIAGSNPAPSARYPAKYLKTKSYCQTFSLAPHSIRPPEATRCPTVGRMLRRVRGVRARRAGPEPPRLILCRVAADPFAPKASRTCKFLEEYLPGHPRPRRAYQVPTRFWSAIPDRQRAAERLPGHVCSVRPLSRRSGSGATMDIGGWLRGLGLGQYEAAFHENKIDGEVLPQLTAEDLKDIGVAIVGDRRKMLTGIAELSTTPASPIAVPGSAPGQGSARDVAERRQLSVMFCDLGGSTAMSARLDPEDMREVISAYHRCCAGLIERGGGFVAKYIGDGVLAFFGYPQAHEHDAERAVQAGLAIVEAAPKLLTAAGSPLHVRIGIATGLVVVGDLIGSGEAQERGVVGDTPNLAARLQGIAKPGTVVIAESTRRLLVNLFELRDLGGQDLKGIAGPARAWVAVRPSSVEGRFDALHGTGLTALVGREEEFDLLVRRWFKAKTGEGHVVLLSGEAGIGKSRLTAALLERLASEPHMRLRYFCSPQHTDSAFYPIIGQMERSAGFAHDDTQQAKLDKLDALLAQTSTSTQDAALVAEMLSLPNDGRYPVLDLASQQRRQKTLEALTAQLAGLAGLHPVLMIFEDAHWTAPTSLEAFGRTVDRIKTLPVLLIVTFRPEFNPPWAGQSRVTSVTLNRLGEREAAAIIARLVGNKELPADVMAEIVERTDGIPLFVEEMTKAVLEAESEGEARRAAAAIPSPALAGPASLHASLMARLDRLGPAKEVAQIGSAIGREFSHALLAVVVPKPEAELRLALDRLIEAGLLFRQGLPPHATYLFKHALIQDAAYGTLLREPRRALHARIAATLESQFAETAENQPELLARHCTEAGLIEKAAGLWGKAGQKSLARAALLEGAEQLKRALDQIATLPATPALRHEEIKLEVAFANALALTGDLVDGKEHYDRALAIYHPAEHPPLTTRSGRDVGVTLLSFRASCVWQLCYPAASRQ